MESQKNIDDILGKTTIYFRVTSLCNADCDFCYRDLPGEKGLPTKEAKHIIELIHNHGFGKISLIGGEVFLRKDINELIEYSYEKGLDISIPTNGSKLDDKEIEFLNKYISWIGLPLDGSTPERSMIMRESWDQYTVTMNLLKKFKERKPGFKIRVSTLVSALNTYDIEATGELLYENKNIHQPEGWRLIRFMPLENGLLVKDKHGISKELFEQATQSSIDRFGLKYKVTRNNSHYLFVGADGSFLISKEDQYINLGKFTEISHENLLSAIGPEILTLSYLNTAWKYPNNK